MRQAKELAAAQAAAAHAEAVRLRKTRHRHPGLEDQLPKVTLKPGVVLADEARCWLCSRAVVDVLFTPWLSNNS